MASESLLPFYIPLSRILELTKLVQAVDAFTMDVLKLTPLCSNTFFGVQAHDLTRRVRALEREVIGWDNIIFTRQGIVPQQTVHNLKAETQTLFAATKAIHDYFNYTIRVGQERAVVMAPVQFLPSSSPSPIPPAGYNSPNLSQMHISGSSVSSSSSSSSSSSNSSVQSVVSGIHYPSPSSASSSPSHPQVRHVSVSTSTPRIVHVAGNVNLGHLSSNSDSGFDYYFGSFSPSSSTSSSSSAQSPGDGSVSDYNPQSPDSQVIWNESMSQN